MCPAPSPAPGVLEPFENRTVTLRGAPEVFLDVAFALSSPTRVAVLEALMASPEALHIQELARRVGVDASPVRGHLEVLLKAGLVRELTGTVGRERRFTTTLTGVRIVIEGVDAPVAVSGEPSKDLLRIEKKLERLHAEAAKIRAEAARLEAERTRMVKSAAGPSNR